MLACLRILILSSAVILIVCLSMLPLLAMEIVRRVLGSLLGAFASGLGALAALSSSLLTLIAYAIWLILRGEWVQLIRLIPELLDWLRAAGLL